MNKLTKASIATGSGVILLMGGAASLAYWNDTEELGADGTTVNAGQLSIAPINGASDGWVKQFNGTGDQALTDLTGVQIVPGNTLIYTDTFEVTATGDDLAFEIEPADAAVDAASSDTEDTALEAILADGDIDVTVVEGASISEIGTSGVYEVTDNAGAPATITVTWTIDWPFGGASSPATDNAAQLGAVDLVADGALTVTQVIAP
ncbi:alternate-type signal peptide domain-containing protein [Demequina sp. NBRC 110053]|uniref:alternate-type signal peptide domain-containing protein n=1 Tax=Demequina sp. NBRC 110053 TaxID=1570342 RepID=UPI0013564A41|nr:alternate-type signal peptide domain-containing protein [Demequina sp. NBRC 110053]